MCGCESWTIRKAECWRTDAFKLWCWRRLLRVSWTARRSNQSTLKENSPEYSLEGLMLNWSSNPLATWFEELTHYRRPWCWERLKAGGERDDREWDGWMASMETSLSKLQELVMEREVRRATVHEVAKSWTHLSNWTELSWVRWSLLFYRWKGVAEWVEWLASRSCGQVSDSSFFLLVFPYKMEWDSQYDLEDQRPITRLSRFRCDLG